MKNIYRILMLSAIAILISVNADAGYKDGYYTRMDGKKREALKVAAKECVSKHTTLNYTNLPNYWINSDVYPDLYNGCKRWWDMYSDEVYLIQSWQSGRDSFSANRMQREHAVPKSWWKKNGNVEYTPAYSDMWNLYPSDGAANQAKLHYPFGIADRLDFDNGVTKVGTAKAGYGGGSKYVFEPADEYKGDFARAVFYMATVYDDLDWVYTYIFRDGSYPSLQNWAIEMLLQWSRTDRVSQKEIERNNYVEQSQGNRNPFVDFPELAEYIWGLRMSETFYIQNQEGSDPTEPITGDPEITVPVNGETLDFGAAAVNGSVHRVLEIVGKNLKEPLSVRVSGTDASLFVPETTSIPAPTINGKGGYLLGINYMPVSAGTHSAKIILYDGGIDGSIVVNLKGEAREVGTLTAPHALEATNISDTGYTANWEAPSGEADYYVLTRVRYLEGNQEAETYETGELNYPITGREAGVAESYTVQYSRLGVLSPASNVIYVAATGITQTYAPAPFRVEIDSEGITIVCNEGEGGNITITDVNGINVIYNDAAIDGARYLLPAGIYLLHRDGYAPMKIVI